MAGPRLLPFPPPYRAALAVSNDIDDVHEPAGWWDYLRFLNTRESTPLGPGLGLEVGESFWFYSDHFDEQPASWFQGLGDRPSPFAPYFAALGRSGHLDTLHSWGNFSRHGGFTRAHAERAARVLRDEGFVPRVWVNHGGGHDFQNLWMGCGDLPENPEAAGAPAPEYHLDLTWPLGFRYAWIGELTQVIGQERRWRAGDWLPSGAALREILGQARRGMARRLAYRDVLETFPNPDVRGNRLLRPRTLRDGRTVQTFVRYGDFRRATFADLRWLLSDRYLDTLAATGGASVLFLHWGKHPGRRFTDLPESGLDALRRLARRVAEGLLWVTTTSRLLAYMEARAAVRLRPGGAPGTHVIDSATLPDGRRLTVQDLAGLSWETSEGVPVSLTLDGETVPLERDGRIVRVPFAPLRFPDPPETHG